VADSDAASLARLLMAMETGKLISQAASSEMLSLLRHLEPIVELAREFAGVVSVTYSDLDDPARPDRGINWAGSYIATGLVLAMAGRVENCASKIGISGAILTDLAVAQCRIGGVGYRFGIVVVDGRQGTPPTPTNITQFVEAFFSKLESPGNEIALGRR
jgi:hypothetical protein